MATVMEGNRTAIDPIALRRAFGTFVTGVTVITTVDADGKPRGMTANSFSSVSLDPPLLLVCVNKGALSYPAFCGSDRFAVNMLRDSQIDVSNLFASKAPDKFASVSYDVVHTGAPVLTDCLSWFDCTTYERVDAGDHTILVGRVQAFGTSPSAPLGFCRGRYAQVKDPLPPGWLSSTNMIVGYLIEAQGEVLLVADGNGGWVLPTAPRKLVNGRLPVEGGRELSLMSDDTFLYSVFDVAGHDSGYLIYRARLAEPRGALTLPPGFRFFAPSELPYHEIVSTEMRAMLRRFVRESEHGGYSIYVDSHDGGRLAAVGTAQPWVRNAQA